MTTVTIDFSVSEEALARVERALEQEAARNPNWNGAVFEIEREEYTSVQCRDEYAGTDLLHNVIFPAIDGHED